MNNIERGFGSSETEKPKEVSKKEAFAVLDAQESQLTEKEKLVDKKTLSGVKKWLASAVVVGSSFLAVGCSKEEEPIFNAPDGQKIESTQDGFTDNAHDNVKQRLKIKRDEIKRMHENSRIVK